MTTLISILLTLSYFSHAAPACSTTPQKIAGIEEICDEALPKCISEVGGAEKIAATLNDSQNRVDTDELFTRLIFAESLASGCNINDPEIFESIAWTLKNRLARKKIYGGSNDDRSVALKPQQFSSSTGPCDVSKRTEFFCPTKDKDFEAAWLKASQAWTKTKTAKNPIPTVRHYFFSRHFDKSAPKGKKFPDGTIGCQHYKGIPASWEKPGDKIKSIGTCATFHNVKE